MLHCFSMNCQNIKCIKRAQLNQFLKSYLIKKIFESCHPFVRLLLFTCLTDSYAGCTIKCNDKNTINQSGSYQNRSITCCASSHVILQDRTFILLHRPSVVNSCMASTCFHSIFPVAAPFSSQLFSVLMSQVSRCVQSKLPWSRG